MSAPSRPTVLVTGPGYRDSDLERLAVRYDVIVREVIGRDELDAIVPDVDVYLLGGDERLDADVLERAERLRAVSFVGVGVGSFVDVEAASRQGIRLLNTPGTGTRAVVEHTIGLLLGLRRLLFEHAATSRSAAPSFRATEELAGATVGVFGLGDIGLSLAKLLVHGFDATVLYASRTAKPEAETALGLERVDRAELFERSDAVALLASTSPETIGIIDEPTLRAARPGLLLVNTASAALVDPAALLAALEDDTVAAAAFDGYWTEPLPTVDDDPHGLLRLPPWRFVVTPHVAAKTTQAWHRMLGQAVDNALAAAPVEVST